LPSRGAPLDFRPAMTDPAQLTARASSLKAAGRLDEAVALYDRIVRLHPDNHIAWHNYASLLGDLSRFAEGAEAAGQAIARGSRAPETQLVLARALQGCERFDDADAAFREAIRLRPGYAAAHHDLAQLRWMRTADVATALAALDAADDPSGDLGTIKATILLAAGDAEAAGAVLARALERAPGNAALHLRAAQAAAERGDAAGQLDHAAEALRLAPGAAQAAKATAEALLHAGRVAEAEALIARLRTASPQDQGALALLATAWRLRGDPRYQALCEDPALISTTRIAAPEGWRDLDAFLTDLAAALRERHPWQAHPLDNSVRRGSQTQENLARAPSPVIRALFAALDAPIRAHIAALGRGRDPVRSRAGQDYRIAGAWSVMLGSGGFHTDHVHPQGWLSSAFYVALPDAIAREPEGWLAFGRPGIPTTPPLAPFRRVRPEPGMLALFPSYLWHGTEPFASGAPRLTVAFDILPE
jgi:uncharacterized protein (TIGR02466 family)